MTEVLDPESFDALSIYLPSRVALFALPCFLAAALQLAIPPYPGSLSDAALATETLANASEPVL